jgi:hypothetical protein
MKVLAKTPRDFVLTFNDEDFEGLSENQKQEMISRTVKEIVFNQVSWVEIKENVAF